MILLFSYLTIVLAQDTFNADFASQLFFMTSASYCSQKHIENWNCGKPCNQVPQFQDLTIFYNETKHIAGYAGYQEETNQIYFIFRGTLPWSISNWIEDIDFIKVKYPLCSNGCQVHRGFYYAFKSIQDQIYKKALELKAKYPTATITISGHSLGGALANHALAFFWNVGIKITNFYTFGAPRVGDRAFFEFMNVIVHPGPKYRVTHDRDPVPHLPFLNWGFEHVNTEVYYDDILFIHKKVKICNDNEGEDSSCSDSSTINLSVEDHAAYMGYNMAIGLVVCQ